MTKPHIDAVFAAFQAYQTACIGVTRRHWRDAAHAQQMIDEETRRLRSKLGDLGIADCIDWEDAPAPRAPRSARDKAPPLRDARSPQERAAQADLDYAVARGDEEEVRRLRARLLALQGERLRSHLRRVDRRR